MKATNLLNEIESLTKKVVDLLVLITTNQNKW